MKNLIEAMEALSALRFDAHRQCVDAGLSAADVANKLFTIARAVGKQAFAAAVVQRFVSEPALQALDLTVDFEDTYNDQGGTFRTANVYVKPVFTGRPTVALEGSCDAFDPELALENDLSDEEAIEDWSQACRDVLESEAGWIDEADVWTHELRFSRSMIEAVTKDGLIDLSALWRGMQGEAANSSKLEPPAILSA